MKFSSSTRSFSSNRLSKLIDYSTLQLIKLFTDAIMLVLFIYEFRLLKNLQYQILLE